MRKSRLAYFVVIMLILLAFAPMMFAHAKVATVGPGVGNVPQGTQSDTAYTNSFATNHVTNIIAIMQKTSCYTPEVPYGVNDGPNDGYSGESSLASYFLQVRLLGDRFS